MSFSFRASHEQRVEMLKPAADLLHGIKEQASRLKWKPRQESGAELAFKVGLNFWSWGENVRVSLTNGIIVVRSECSFPLQLVDWGKNRTNVSALLAALMPAGSLAEQKPLRR